MCRRIKIKKVDQLLLNPETTEIVVFRLCRPDNTPYNFVWVFGNIEKARAKLFYEGKTGFVQTDLGMKYDAKFPTESFRIEIGKPRLKRLCRDLKIRKVIIVRFNTY